MDGDRNYFIRRADEERAAASNAQNPQARQSHLELAERYDELAIAIDVHERRVSAASPLNNFDDRR